MPWPGLGHAQEPRESRKADKASSGRLPTHERDGAMREFTFTITLQGVRLTKSLEDALFEAGCDDALVGTHGQEVFLDFTRKARSLEEALKTAVSCVQSALKRVRRSAVFAWMDRPLQSARSSNHENTKRRKREKALS